MRQQGAVSHTVTPPLSDSNKPNKVLQPEAASGRPRESLPGHRRHRFPWLPTSARIRPATMDSETRIGFPGGPDATEAAVPQESRIGMPGYKPEPPPPPPPAAGGGTSFLGKLLPAAMRPKARVAIPPAPPAASQACAAAAADAASAQRAAEIDEASARRLREALAVIASGDLDECPLCLEVPSAADARVLRCCGAILCVSCIRQLPMPAIDGNPSTCPMCRGHFQAREFHEAEATQDTYCYSTIDYSGVGYTATDFRATDFQAPDVQAPSYHARDHRAASYHARENRAASYHAPELEAESYTATETKAREYTAASYTAHDYSAQEYKATNYEAPNYTAV